MRLTAAVMAMTVAGVAGAAPVSPFDVGDRAQLFVDRVLVHHTERVWFALHPATKHPANPIVVPDHPWEGWRLALYGSVIRDDDEGLFKMWYWGAGCAVAYAQSPDGIHWEKPSLGVTSWQGSTENNIVHRGAHCPAVVKDDADPDPARRYKMICFSSGYHTWVSPDGFTWTQFSQEPICPRGDVISGYYDRARGLWVAFPKLGTEVRGFNRRCFSVITSEDFLTWSEPVAAFVPDLRDDAGALARTEQVRPLLTGTISPGYMRTEFYGLGVYQQESCTLAFPWVITVTGSGKISGQDGPSELQLAVSRDLEHWERPFREPCVPRGKIGEWDSGWFYSAAEALRVGDEVWLYYGGGNYTHASPAVRAETYDDGTPTGRGTIYKGGIGLAIWKLDRFVSADAGSDGGTLTTVPVVFAGNRLELNATTSEGGGIAVEVLDMQGKVLGRSAAFSGDELRQTLQWEQDPGLAALAGTPVQLRFVMRNAELYSFAFRG